MLTGTKQSLALEPASHANARATDTAVIGRSTKYLKVCVTQLFLFTSVGSLIKTGNPSTA